MRDFSRVWSVWRGVLLQMWGTFLAFGEFGLTYCSKCGELFSRLERRRALCTNLQKSRRIFATFSTDFRFPVV
ncbi:hypothetical protein AXE76_03270 [Gardnerella vaginalis]|uniref:Uncharacterized protein n=1 Tax=Gardnerella vaginalis TaxID=2702 RepID=A0A3E1IR14_GARVA|nr:hypothetical protein AXE76_03270 [Gardnerella vaginalis]